MGRKAKVTNKPISIRENIWFFLLKKSLEFHIEEEGKHTTFELAHSEITRYIYALTKKPTHKRQTFEEKRLWKKLREKEILAEMWHKKYVNLLKNKEPHNP